MSQNAIYTEEELGQLNKIKETRFGIIDKMTIDGVPERVGEIRVLNEVLNSADKMIVDTANLRAKREDSANNGAAVDMVIELLKQTRANKQVFEDVGATPEISAAHKTIEVVDGETAINPIQLTPEEFVTPSFDASKV